MWRSEQQEPEGVEAGVSLPPPGAVDTASKAAFDEDVDGGGWHARRRLPAAGGPSGEEQQPPPLQKPESYHYHPQQEHHGGYRSQLLPPHQPYYAHRHHQQYGELGHQEEQGIGAGVDVSVGVGVGSAPHLRPTGGGRYHPDRRSSSASFRGTAPPLDDHPDLCPLVPPPHLHSQQRMRAPHNEEPPPPMPPANEDVTGAADALHELVHVNAAAAAATRESISAPSRPSLLAPPHLPPPARLQPSDPPPELARATVIGDLATAPETMTIEAEAEVVAIARADIEDAAAASLPSSTTRGTAAANISNCRGKKLLSSSSLSKLSSSEPSSLSSKSKSRKRKRGENPSNAEVRTMVAAETAVMEITTTPQTGEAAANVLAADEEVGGWQWKRVEAEENEKKARGDDVDSRRSSSNADGAAMGTEDFGSMVEGSGETSATAVPAITLADSTRSPTEEDGGIANGGCAFQEDTKEEAEEEVDGETDPQCTSPSPSSQEEGVENDDDEASLPPLILPPRPSNSRRGTSVLEAYEKLDHARENYDDHLPEVDEAKLELDRARKRYEEALEIHHLHRAEVRKREEELIEAEQSTDCKWNKMFRRLVEFKEDHGHCRVPLGRSDRSGSEGGGGGDHDNKELCQLGSWVNQQRKMYRVFQKDPDLKEAVGRGEVHRDLQPHRIVALDKLGFLWEVRQEQWRRKMEDLAEYRREHGNCAVPFKYPPNQALAYWVHGLRQQYHAYRTNKPSEMTEGRIEELERAGFLWKSDFPRTARKQKPLVPSRTEWSEEKDWQENFRDLVEFRKVHGHTRVHYKPSSSSVVAEATTARVDLASKRLGMFATWQRKQYKLWREGQESTMTEERCRRMEEIGFEWTAVRNPLGKGGRRRKIKKKENQEEEEKKKVQVAGNDDNDEGEADDCEKERIERKIRIAYERF